VSDDAKPGMGGLLGWIERVGNKVPHPAIIFLGLIAVVIVLSAVLSAVGVSVTYQEAVEVPPAVTEDSLGGSVAPDVILSPDYTDDVELVERTTEVQSLLNVDGIRFLFSSFVSNFAGFSVVAVVLVAMLGIGVAEEAGLMAALIRKLVAVSSAGALTFIIVFIGMLSSVASDAGYLILIPLGAAAFLSVGRHPLAGLVAAFGGVSAGFAANILITPTDSLITEVTNEATALVNPALTIDITANLWFSIASTFFVTVVVTLIVTKLVEPRLGIYAPEPALATVGGGGSAGSSAGPVDGAGAGATDDHADVDKVSEARGLRFALWAVLAVVAVVALATIPSGAPLRNPETGAVIGDSPFMTSLVFIITLIFLFAGIAYGRGAKTISSSVDVINAIVKTFASLSGLIFLLLLISQFIAYFNYSELPTVAAVELADLLERANIGAVWLLIGFILVIAVLNIIIPGVLPKWAIFAPIFVPLFINLGVAPQTVLAAYRVGDGPLNVITPLMVYLPFIVIVAQRYRKDAGIGTIIALMLPIAVILLVAWTLFFVVWFVLGIPMGPGFPVNL
jgi:aminobenzoyl-glutamate transport protein